MRSAIMATQLTYLKNQRAYVERALITRIVSEDSIKGIMLDKTPSYPKGGGQPGDKGIIHFKGGRGVRFHDTIHFKNDVLHKCDTLEDFHIGV